MKKEEGGKREGDAPPPQAYNDKYKG